MLPEAPKISVIVPVLNEAAGLPEMARHWRELAEGGAEVLVVDGGSADATAELAEAAGFAVLAAPPGRAAQMNHGARRAVGSALLFLHADTRLPENALELMGNGLGSRHCWGRFDVRIEGRPPLLRVVAALMNLRSRLTGIATGDQALFMTRQAFEAVRGFPDQPLMEDIEISARLKRLTPPLCLAAKATTSGRRWESQGVLRTIVRMWCLRLAYGLGVPAGTLARAYR
jgi:rSAM/selenodomain-associated transferase 2